MILGTSFDDVRALIQSVVDLYTNLMLGGAGTCVVNLMDVTTGVWVCEQTKWRDTVTCIVVLSSSI